MTWLRSKRARLRWAVVACALGLALLGATVRSGMTAFSSADLVAHLSVAGATVAAVPGKPEADVFSGAGHVLAVNGANVQVYEYPLPLAADLDASHISADCSTSQFLGGSRTVDWIATPHCFKRGRIIVTYIGDSTAMTRLLTSVLGAQFAGGS